MNKLNIAKEILIELETLENTTIGFKESVAVVNLALNAARRLAEQTVIDEEAA